MSTLLRRIRDQRGQVLLMFVALFTVLTIFGVVIVDFGLWFSERRGAQTDADLPALAGARECMLQLVTGTSHDPYPAIDKWFDENNGGNAELVADDTSTECEPQPNGELCVNVVVKHKSQNIFSALPFVNHALDNVAGDIRAYARACAGGIEAPWNVIPLDTYAVCPEADPPAPGPCFNADGTPKVGEVCGLEFGAQSGTACNNPRGQLDLWAGAYCSNAQGPANVEDLIRDSAPGICLLNDTGICNDWYQCAETVTGNAQNVLDGVNARVTKNHLCDDNYRDPAGVNNVDDLSEAAPEQAGVREARDCDPNTSGEQISQRLVSLIVFSEYPTDPNTPYPISAFGGFYLKGCTKTVEDCTDPNYNWSVDDLNCAMHGQIGHAVVCGEFVKLIVSGSGIGGVNDSTTQFGIALVDWESGGTGGTPGPTSVPTVAPSTPAPPTPTPCPCGVKGNGECKPCH